MARAGRADTACCRKTWVALWILGTARGVFGTNTLCHWNGTNQIVVREWQQTEFIQRGAITLASGVCPNGFAYNPDASFWPGPKEPPQPRFTWPASRRPAAASNSKVKPAECFTSTSVRTEVSRQACQLQSLSCAWIVETGLIVAAIDETMYNSTFVADGRVPVTAVPRRNGHEIHGGPAMIASPSGVQRASPLGSNRCRWRAPFWEEIAAAEAKEKLEIKEP